MAVTAFEKTPIAIKCLLIVLQEYIQEIAGVVKTEDLGLVAFNKFPL
jgi:hypothetical protein